MTDIPGEHPAIISGIPNATDLLDGASGPFEELHAALLREQLRADELKMSVHAARRIGMAVGMLMARYDMSEDEAFASLEQTSRHNGRLLQDAAEDVLHARGLRG